MTISAESKGTGAGYPRPPMGGLRASGAAGYSRQTPRGDQGGKPVTSPTAGWYSDPVDTDRIRWWTGCAWTQQTMASEARAAVAVASPAIAATYGAHLTRGHTAPRLTPSQIRAARGAISPLGYVALVAAVAGAILNPYALVSLIAVILGILGIGMTRDTHGSASGIAARLTAVFAIVIGLVEVGFFVSQQLSGL